jgi:glycosyltransferase involved in cell wall biosynthesis
MHIAIDTSATYLTSAGTTTYIHGLINGLKQIAPEIKITELACKPFFSRKRKLLRILDTLYRELIWINFILPRLAYKSGADILHCPAMMAPYKCKLPIVLTILDLYVIRSPKSFPIWQRTIMGKTLKKTLNYAATILVISEFTKKEIHSCYPSILPGKIVKTLLGVEDCFSPVTNIDKQLNFKKKYSINSSFILSVSTIEPRKNLKILLKSFASIKDHISHNLLLVGSSGWLSSDIHYIIENLGIKNRVHFLGYIDMEELQIAYSIASVFVYISLYEGFGLPPLEAMACGCPVITSNIASIPEVVGDAAIKVNPLIAEETSAAIIDIISNPFLQKSLAEKGINRVKQFTWQNCAISTLENYKVLTKKQFQQGKIFGITI